MSCIVVVQNEPQSIDRPLIGLSCLRFQFFQFFLFSFIFILFITLLFPAVAFVVIGIGVGLKSSFHRFVVMFAFIGCLRLLISLSLQFVLSLSPSLALYISSLFCERIASLRESKGAKQLFSFELILSLCCCLFRCYYGHRQQSLLFATTTCCWLCYIGINVCTNTHTHTYIFSFQNILVFWTLQLTHMLLYINMKAYKK